MAALLKQIAALAIAPVCLWASLGARHCRRPYPEDHLEQFISHAARHAPTGAERSAP